MFVHKDNCCKNCPHAVKNKTGKPEKIYETIGLDIAQ